MEVYGSTTYWASFFLTVALANISSFALRFWSNYFSPTPTSIVSRLRTLFAPIRLSP